nr:MAG TPA: hypothetical protein [Caudoviricetes sp.]
MQHRQSRNSLAGQAEGRTGARCTQSGVDDEQKTF